MVLAAETVERRLLGSHFLREWIGGGTDTLTDKTFCAASYDGVDFDPDDSLDTAPFTPQEVLGSAATPGVGYVLMWMGEITRTEGMSSGLDGGGNFVTQPLTELMCTFEVVVPSSADVALLELYLMELENRFAGITVRHTGPPFVVLRQLAGLYPLRRRKGDDDGTWQRRFLDVRIQRRERLALAGLKGVPLP